MRLFRRTALRPPRVGRSSRVKLYAGTTEQFRADAQMHRIAEKLRAEYVAQIGHKPGAVRGRRLAEQPHGAVAARRPGGARRPRRHPRVPARQHQQAARRDAHRPIAAPAPRTPSSSSSSSGATTGAVERRRLRRDVRRPADPAGAPSIGPGRRLPAMAARQPRRLLRRPMRSALTAVSYLHNMQFDPTGELCAPNATPSTLAANPLFTGDQSDRAGRIPEPRLSAPATASRSWPACWSRSTGRRRSCSTTPPRWSPANSEFVLLDEQFVAFESVLAEARDGLPRGEEVGVLDPGRPRHRQVASSRCTWSASSPKLGYNAQHATGSKAFTENIRRIVGKRAGGSQFRYFNQYGDADAERHRRPDPRRGASAPRDLRQPLHAEGQAHRSRPGRRAHRGGQDIGLLHRRPPGRPPERGRQHQTSSARPPRATAPRSASSSSRPSSASPAPRPS